MADINGIPTGVPGTFTWDIPECISEQSGSFLFKAYNMVEDTTIRKLCSMLKITSTGGENKAGCTGPGVPESVGCSFKQGDQGEPPEES